MTPVVVPVLLVKNEEVWISRILSAVCKVFPHVIVTDTGSTDSTIEQIQGIPAVTLFTFQNVDPKGLTEKRQFMQEIAKQRFGATHIFLIDGDELYPSKYLQFIHDNPMAEHCLSGFTSGVECCELENGQFWYYGAHGAVTGLNRQAIIPVGSTWKGTYPFESPDCYIPGSPLNHYFAGPDETFKFFHVHHTRRSRMDGEVYLREQKRRQFSMRDAPPEIQPFKLWLKDWESYVDE